MPQDEEGAACSKGIKDEMVWTRKARRAVLLEHRTRNNQEEQDLRNILHWLGGVTPAEDDMQHKETELRVELRRRGLALQQELHARWMAEKHEKDLEHLRSGEAHASLPVGHFQREVATRTRQATEQPEHI